MRLRKVIYVIPTLGVCDLLWVLFSYQYRLQLSGGYTSLNIELSHLVPQLLIPGVITILGAILLYTTGPAAAQLAVIATFISSSFEKNPPLVIPCLLAILVALMALLYYVTKVDLYAELGWSFFGALVARPIERPLESYLVTRSKRTRKPKAPKNET
jgi:hypothetical protein